MFGSWGATGVGGALLVQASPLGGWVGAVGGGGAVPAKVGILGRGGGRRACTGFVKHEFKVGKMTHVMLR